MEMIDLTICLLHCYLFPDIDYKAIRHNHKIFKSHHFIKKIKRKKFIILQNNECIEVGEKEPFLKSVLQFSNPINLNLIRHMKNNIHRFI